jgi:hypothetical protein
MIKNKNHYYLSTIIIFLVSVTFALLIGSGAYGYGHDYYVAYQKPNLFWGSIFDRYGFAVATLTINKFHIGVHIATFILCISSGLLIREHIKFKQSYSLILFISLYIIAIHTWPIIMSTSNAMRQGLSMSFIFLAILYSSRDKYFWMTFFSFIAVFMHKSGLILATIIIFASLVNRIFRNFSHKKKSLIFFLTGTVLFFVSYQVLRLIGFVFNDEGTRIIGGDFRGAFVFIGFAYVFMSFFFKSILNNSFNITLYFFSFIALSFLANGLNWQFERLGMMMLIPYILAFGVVLNKFSYKIYLSLTLPSLLFLTIFMGMYASLK